MLSRCSRIASRLTKLALANQAVTKLKALGIAGAAGLAGGGLLASEDMKKAFSGLSPENAEFRRRVGYQNLPKIKSRYGYSELGSALKKRM